MEFKEWIQVIIPIVGVITAVISAALSYYFTKRHQVSIEERKLKEVYYTDYIKAVSRVVVEVNSSAKDDLADKQNRLLLIGSSEVVNTLMDFHNYIKPESTEKNGFSSDIHDELLTKLVKAMRRDLYGSKKINDNYPIIHLTGRARNNNK